MGKWVVYFEQVNQDAIEVEADTRDEARQKAMKDWKRNIYPNYTIVAVLGKEAFVLPKQKHKAVEN